VRLAPERDHAAALRWILSAVATACLGYLVAVLLVPSLRRLRRRTRGTADERILGSWHDLLDQLADMGKAPSPGATNSDVAHVAIRASGRVSVPAVTSLAELATHALFAPSSSTEAQVDSAWRYCDETRAVLRRATPVRRRVRARLTVVRVGGGYRENTRRRTRVRRR
jgi:hypothetical protein